MHILLTSCFISETNREALMSSGTGGFQSKICQMIIQSWGTTVVQADNTQSSVP